MRTFTYTWESDNRLLHLLKYFEIISKFGKLSSGHRAGKRSVFIPIPKKGSAKECSNYSTIALISHARKIISKARRQKYLNRELPDVQTDFRKGRRTRDQIANICCIVVKAREFPKTSTSASLTMLKPLTVEHNKLENSSKDWNTRPLYLPPEKPVCRLRSSS